MLTIIDEYDDALTDIPADATLYMGKRAHALNLRMAIKFFDEGMVEADEVDQLIGELIESGDRRLMDFGRMLANWKIPEDSGVIISEV